MYMHTLFFFNYCYNIIFMYKNAIYIIISIAVVTVNLYIYTSFFYIISVESNKRTLF